VALGCNEGKAFIARSILPPTSAGLTTLIDVIAGRKTGGSIKGKIGYETNVLAIRRTASRWTCTRKHRRSARRPHSARS
jgi:ABC-type uncharacterized transport system ATPase subunit